MSNFSSAALVFLLCGSTMMLKTSAMTPMGALM